MTDHSTLFAADTHLQSLKDKHEKIDLKIRDAEKSYTPVDFYLKQLKRQKLLLKDKIHTVMKVMEQQAANA